MDDKELEQQDKQEEKEEKKPVVKRIVGIFILVDLIVVIILLLLFGLKNCKSNSGVSSSSTTSSSQRYDSLELDSVFKKIVKTQMDDYLIEDELKHVVVVSYVDNSTSFDLTISVASDSKAYIYKVTNNEYQGYEDFVSYLLANNNDIPLSGNVTLDTLTLTDELVTTSKSNTRYVVGSALTDEKYLTGYYYDDSGYHIYNKSLLDGSDPFSKQENQLIGGNDLLYDYYQSL